jgi:hypothetical protein
MPIRKYKEIRFSDERRAIIDQAIELVLNYEAQGYSLTLRQLYYQFVSRDLFPQSWADPGTGSTNNERSYKKLGDIINDARMAGLVDWSAIEDRTREASGNNHWNSPADIVAACADQFQIDKWSDQPFRVEVWVEKDALEGVVAQVARRLDVTYFSCRGYASATSIWDAGQRLKRYATSGQTPVILHLGDHDPSGIDMSRDIEARVAMFMDGFGNKLKFERIALNRDQVDEYTPPPNPAKVTDSRFKNYQDEHGDECWELDALEPSVISELIETRVNAYLKPKLFKAKEREQQEHRDALESVASQWDEIVASL